jgi:hypothetical protein
MILACNKVCNEINISHENGITVAALKVIRTNSGQLNL